ncbi:MAG: bifunctional precorrin-2 dehydrogenase/sirohydrochlorin ferrochelatase [Candidatus Aquicultor sp.]|nr:bifunctional precorrin-2 dehydrogenase/sirohydrochlorin ferrochelatase [Candidatus Aquicultor sp.]
MAFYPLYVDLEGRKCVVVGGGEVAERKVVSLLECGADVEVISPDSTPGLEELAREGRLRMTRREYRRGDLGDATLAIVATDDNAVNTEVYREATDNQIPVNVVDVPELCSFIVPSTIRRGDLVISISTSGSCPALAKHIREELEETYRDEYGRFCDMLRDFRARVIDKYDDPKERKKALGRLIESDALDLIRAQDDLELEERVKSCM